MVMAQAKPDAARVTPMAIPIDLVLGAFSKACIHLGNAILIYMK
jgi:hypothetical protein